MSPAKIIGVILLAFGLAGCGTLKALTDPLTEPLPRAASTDAKVMQEARAAIDKGNALLFALNTVVEQNVVEKVWTVPYALEILDESDRLGEVLDRLLAALEVGNAVQAKSEAELITKAIVALQKRAAAVAQ